MKNVPAQRIDGLSIHHYSVIDWGNKGSSYAFTNDQYFKTMQRAWFIEAFIDRNSRIMDRYDPGKRVALVVDEWGGWYDPDPRGGSALYQQNTIRDAMIAGLTLNVFNNHADRVRMANLAQTVNVLQAVILTRGEELILTPTYHVMEMYKVHQDARLIPAQIITEDFVHGDERIPALSVSASLDDRDRMHLSLAHIDDRVAREVEIHLEGFDAKKVSGRILTSENVQDHNTFEAPDRVAPESFSGFKLKNGVLKVEMPPNSVVVLELTK